MRQPRIPLHQLPEHRVLGKKVAAALEEYLDGHAHVEEALHDSIGDPAKPSINDSDMNAAVRAVDQAMGIQRSGRQHDGRTQLDHTIYSTWTRVVKDPDQVMASWLKDGTPMGIEEEAPSVGIFPEVYEKVDEGVQQITLAMDEQARSLADVTAAVDDLTEFSRTTTEKAEALSSTADEQVATLTGAAENTHALLGSARQLRDSLEAFSLGTADDADASSPARHVDREVPVPNS